MARRRRTHTRVAPAARAESPLVEREYIGPRRSPRSSRGLGVARAVGAASPALEKAAAWERIYVVKDFRRIAIVVALVLVMLVLSGIAVNALFPR